MSGPTRTRGVDLLSAGDYVRPVRRVCMFALFAAALGLAAPATSAAQPAQEILSTAQVVKNLGFKLSMSAISTRSAGTSSAWLSIYLNRRSGSGAGSSAEHVAFHFFSGVGFASSSNLHSARISGKLLRGRGSISMVFRATTSPEVVPVPRGCTGIAGERRRGRLKGLLDLKADRLGAVRLATIAASLRIPPSIDECHGDGASHAAHGTVLVSSDEKAGRGFDLYASKPYRTGLVSEAVTMFHVGKGFAFSWTCDALAPRSDYRFTPDLAAGTMKGAGDLHGSATYQGSAKRGGASQGGLDGGLSATFSSIGTVEPLARGSLMADQFSY